eukprot:6308559-Karenia_brevis.AAC.1
MAQPAPGGRNAASLSSSPSLLLLAVSAVFPQSSLHFRGQHMTPKRKQNSENAVLLRRTPHSLRSALR